MATTAQLILVGAFSLAVASTLTSDRALKSWLLSLAPGAPRWIAYPILLSEVVIIWALVAVPSLAGTLAAAWLLVATAVIAYAAYVRRVDGCACFGVSGLASRPHRAVLRNVVLLGLAVRLSREVEHLGTFSAELAVTVAVSASLVGVSRTLATT